jgi:hypothetical protein
MISRYESVFGAPLQGSLFRHLTNIINSLCSFSPVHAEKVPLPGEKYCPAAFATLRLSRPAGGQNPFGVTRALFSDSL